MDSLISIIIPVYNVEPYLQECVDSVLQQTYKNLEVILVNDGSTDLSGQICDEYIEKDPRVKVIHKENGGLSDARNAGFESATGEYTYFLDSDDFIADTAMEECLIIARKEQADFVFFDGVNFFEREIDKETWKYSYARKDKYTTDKGYKVLSELNSRAEYTPLVQLLFIRTRYIHEHGFQFYKGILHEEHAYTLSLYLYASNVAHINKALFYRRVRPNSIMTSQVSAKNFIGRYTACCEMFKLYESDSFNPDVRSAIRPILSNMSLNCMYVFHGISRAEQKTVIPERENLCRKIKSVRYLNSLRLRLACSNRVVFLICQTIYRLICSKKSVK